MISRKYLLIKFVLVVIIMTVITGGITALFYYSEVETAKTLLKSTETINIKNSRGTIDKNLENITADLMILSQHNSFTQIVTDTNTLAEDMLIMIGEKHSYEQLRYINETGMEAVRVNFNKGQPNIVADDKLQNKANRYYFKETLTLLRGEVFISPFDLNVEHGKIELPYKPMLRFGTPVFDKQGHKRGIIIINYFGAELIHDLLVAAPNITDHIALLNSDSYWLHNPDPELEWGFMLEHDQRFKNQFPGSWKQITETDSGQFLDSNGLFTFDTVYPLSGKQKVGSSIRTVNAMSSNYYWKIVSHVSLATIQSNNTDIMTKLLRTVGPLYLLMILGGFWLTYISARHKQAERSTRESLSLFEAMLESTGDGILITSEYGKVIHTNSRFVEIWQIPEKIIASGDEIAMLNHVQDYLTDAQKFIQDVERIHGDAETDNLDLLEFKDGRVIERGSHSILIEDKPVGRLWSFRDITEGIQAKEALQKAHDELEQRVEERTRELSEVNEALNTDITERKRVEEELLKLSRAVEASSSTVIITDTDGNIEYVNPKFTEITGYTREEVIGGNTRLLKSGKTPEAIYSDMWETILTGGEWKGKYHNRKKDGSLYWSRCSISGVKNSEGEITHYISIQDDVSEQMKVEEELLKLSRAVEASSSAVIITDDEGNIEYVNPKFSEVTGYTKDEAMGQNPRILKSGETADTIYDDLWETITSGREWKGEFHNRKKDGGYYWGHATISGVRDTTGKITHYVGIQDDVTYEYELAEQLSYQASHDALTGLINRREFERRAERLLSTIKHDKSEHALCFMDLDQFKIVNDTCGHTAGDEMLRQISQILQSITRKRDTMARLGGDEFGILMEHCSLDKAHRVASSLQEAIHDYQFNWEGQSFRVGVSIGLVSISELTLNLTELLKQADAACYMAKDKGRNRIHVYHAEDASLVQRHGEMQWVSRIQHALDEDRFCLYAQSILPLDSSQSKHYELLIRMVDEEDKLIPPGAFLPAAERYNLIEKLDCWVIEHAFRVLAENPTFLKKINFISINLSGQSLTQASMLDFIISRLDSSGIEGEKICFEITETAAIANLSTAMKFISTLKGLGCRFALDDFGSGLSSFGYLKNLPVDYLKIDGMFVRDIVDDPIDRAMVKSINEIGQVMGMQTIAEFVENDEIKGMLREIGVNYAQGYGIDKPMPFDELLGLFNKKNKN